jgi:formamidopyrimidine-DNA glycosylase
MPELPEVETIARQLNAVLPGKTIESVRVLREKSFKGETTKLHGLSIRVVHRKAKNIILEFDSAELVMLIHLKMTGQLIYQIPGTRHQTPDIRNQILEKNYKSKTGRWSLVTGNRVVGGHPTPDWVNELPSKHTRAMIMFTDGSRLYFNDMRVFGWIRIISNFQFSIFKQRLPPDVVDPEFTVSYLTKVLKSSKRPVKLVLLDQAKVGGLGNIYVNDALYLSGTKPTRRANSLRRAEIERLHEACVQVIARGIEVGGASESTYKHINGMGGKYQEEFLIYKREGFECGRGGCSALIVKMKLGGRGTYYCPACQR